MGEHDGEKFLTVPGDGIMFLFCSYPSEGRIAVVTDVGCGMRWTRKRRAQSICADERRLTWTAKSCGPGAPTLALSWRWCFASRGRRGQESPVPGETTYKP